MTYRYSILFASAMLACLHASAQQAPLPATAVSAPQVASKQAPTPVVPVTAASAPQIANKPVAVAATPAVAASAPKPAPKQFTVLLPAKPGAAQAAKASTPTASKPVAAPAVAAKPPAATTVPVKTPAPAVAPPPEKVAESVGPTSTVVDEQKPVAPPKPKAQTLPGLGVMPGEADDRRIKVVRIGSDRTEEVYIASGQLNKISTPFESPQAIDGTGATLKQVGQDIFVKPAADKPFTIYISNGGVGPSVGIVLVPKQNIAAQTIVLQPDASTLPVASSRAEADEPIASDYVGRLNGLVKQVVLGKVPAGFTQARLPRAVITARDYVIQPQAKLSGSIFDIYSYKLTSATSVPLELRDEAFYQEGVRAVAIYPSVLLQRGEETTVYVVADHVATKEGSKQ